MLLLVCPDAFGICLEDNGLTRRKYRTSLDSWRQATGGCYTMEAVSVRANSAAKTRRQQTKQGDIKPVSFF